VSAYRGAGGEVAEESLPSQANEVVRAPASLSGQASLSVGGVAALQRRVGNAATVDVLRGAGLIPIAVANQRLQEARAARPGSPAAPDTRFRVPSATELKSLYGGGLLDKSDIEDAVRRALRRMDLDFALRTDAGDVMEKLFPGGGVFDEKAWPSYLGTDTSDVYNAVADAEAKLKAADLKKLTDVATIAADKIDQAMADTAGLADVFGTKAAIAKSRYGKAKTALANAIKNADTAMDTDYNRDDPQVGLGGWANFASQHIHLTGDVAEVTDRDDAIITLIHESCHLADRHVDDLGYYGSDGFEAMEDSEKVNNAAHYEELPARYLGRSLYRIRDPNDKTKFLPGFQKFVPKQTSGGHKVTREGEVRRAASEYLRKAWDAAVDAHQFVRESARLIQAKPADRVFDTRKSSLLQMSKMMKLTIHQQKPKPTTVTVLDVALSEGVAHATIAIQDNAAKQPVPTKGKKAAAVKSVVDGAIAGYGELTGNAADDRKLIDWLVKHYRKGF
jgi:hypothetical protein